MSSVYERLGRKQEQLENLDEAYTTLLKLLAGVVSGEIARSRVLVNLTERSWALVPEGQTPAHPAVINGLPEYVVGQPDAGN